jgi:excisionase family DNA binding protein
MEELADFKTMKKPSSVLEYPIVVRKHLNYITISMPDLGLFETLELPEKNLNKDYVTLLAARISSLWIKATKHVNEKKWVPEASDIKSSVRKATKKDLTPLQFAKQAGVSEQTIRRDIERGIIKAKRTGGGHRKIPESQIPLYLQFLKSGNKRSKDDILIIKKMMDENLEY